MAAGEDQCEPLVGHAHDNRFVRRLVVCRGRGEYGELRNAGAQHAVTAYAVERTVARHRQQPRRRVARDAVARPALERSRERVLDGVLGEIPIADRANERRNRPPDVLAEQAVDGLCCDGSAQDAARSSIAAAARAAYAS
jgi:hypothetical protein